MQTHSDGIEVASGHASIGRKSFGEDEEVPFLGSQHLVIRRKQTTDVGHAIFLGRHGASIRVREQLARDREWRLPREAFFPELDEIGVLREPARVDIQWNPVSPAELRYGTHIRHRYRLTAPGVVRYRQHTDRNTVRSDFRDERLEPLHVHVAFEWMARRRNQALRYYQVARLGSSELDVGPRGVEVGVVRHHMTGPAERREQDALRGAALMGGQHVPKSEDLMHSPLETIPRPAAGVRFIASHHNRPLLR